MGITGVVLVGIVVFCVPGFLFSWISGVRAPWAAAMSLPVSFGIFGFAGWLTSVLGGRYMMSSLIVVWLFFLVIAAVWRWVAYIFDRRPHNPESEGETVLQGPKGVVIETPVDAEFEAAPVASTPTEPDPEPPARPSFFSPGGWSDPRWILPALGVVAGMLLIIIPSIRWLNALPHGMDDVFQGWDVHWHASVIRWIEETGNADPTRMGELHNPENHYPMYYPVAWHAGVWVLAHIMGLSPATAVNYGSIIIPGIVAPLSAATLAWRLINDRSLFSQMASAFAAVIITGIPAYYWIGNYVGAWPYTAALCACGIVLAAFMSAPYRPIMLLACGVSFMGIVQLHPASATVVILGLGLWWLLWLLWNPVRTPQSILGSLGCRLRDVLILAAGGLIGVVPLLPQVLGRTSDMEGVASFSATEDITLAESIRKTITMTTRHVNDGAPFHFMWVVVPALLGLLILIIWRKNIWALLFYLISGILTVNALTPLPDPYGKLLNIVGQFHYATPHRLIMPVALISAASAGVAITAILALLLRPLRRRSTRWAGVSMVALTLLGTGGLGWYAHADVEKEGRWVIQSARQEVHTFTDKDRRAFAWLAKQPKAYDGLIFHDPSDGAGWMYPLEGLPSIARHYHWPMPVYYTDSYHLWEHIDRMGAGLPGDPDAKNETDRLAEKLGVHYVVLSPPNFWAFQVPHEPLTVGSYTAPGLTLVYKEGEDAIFVVNSSFTDEEIQAMRTSGDSPEPLPHQPTYGELGIARTAAEVNKPYFHRPGDGRVGGGSTAAAGVGAQ